MLRRSNWALAGLPRRGMTRQKYATPFAKRGPVRPRC
jgi:hypothetical protein